MSQSTSVREMFAKKITVENAKVFALFILFWLIIGNIVLHFIDGDVCEQMLTDGRPDARNSWRPTGCMTHLYKLDDAKKCANHSALSRRKATTRLVFMGDSRTRQLYQETVRLFQGAESSDKEKKWSDLEYSDTTNLVQVTFLWQPMVNDTMLAKFKSWVDDKDSRPDMIVVGSGTWSIKQSGGSMQAVESFRQNLTSFVPFIEELSDSTGVIWTLQEDVEEPLLGSGHSMITNAQINVYNGIVGGVLHDSSAHVMSSNRLISKAFGNETGDGLHVSDNALRIDVQLLLNYYCNKYVMPIEASCCKAPRPMSWAQYSVLILYAVAVAGAIFNWFFPRPVAVAENGDEPKPEESNFCLGLSAFARFAIVMLYMFVCDRTNFFSHENKPTGLVNLLVPLGGAFAFGLVFTKRLEGKNAGFLNRCQTEEWKGWMQIAILIYHFSGASAVLPVYFIIRAIVSAYIVLNGYAHTCYMLNGGTFGIERLSKQMFRLNFLTVMMCVTMNMPYMFYYFVPLITFWFLVVLFVFWIPPRPVIPRAPPALPTTDADAEQASAPVDLRGPALNVIIRLTILFAIINVFYYSEWLFNLVFSLPPIKFLFVTSDGSLHEWRFRWELDRHSAIVGCLMGLVVAILRHRSLLPDKDSATCRPPLLLVAVMGTSLAALTGFVIWTFTCTNKVECNRFHPWMVPPVVVGYAIIRNLPTPLRIRYSTFMAWFGHISLELFLAQYHIWLAADTKGILVLVPGVPALSVLASTFIFVCAAHEILLATGRLSEKLIPKSPTLLVRNCLIFGLTVLIAGNWRLFVPGQ